MTVLGVIMSTLKNNIMGILKKGLLGGIIEIAVTYLITVIISSFINDGNFYPVVPELIKVCGTEQNAILLQTSLSFEMGFVIGLASLVWQKDSWSLFFQTVVHFILILIAVTPTTWICIWIPHSIKGVVFYICYFIFIYAIIWVSMTVPQIIAIKKINQKIKK